MLHRLRALLRFAYRYGLLLAAGGLLGYQLLFVWAPLWRNAAALEGLDVSAHTVEDAAGRAVPLERFAGRVLVLNFWASWCVPCRVEIPLLADLYPELQAQGKELLGINVAESWSAIAAFRRETPIPFPVYVDRGALVRALKVSVIPAMVVVGPEGRVRKVIYGFRPWVKWYLRWWA